MDLTNTGECVRVAIKLRDNITQMKARHKAELAPLMDAQVKLASHVLALLKSQGTESAKTESGTAYTTTKTYISVADKAAFLDFIIANGLFELLDIHANKTAVEDYLAQNDALPPGVNLSRELDVGFRRA